MGALKNLWNSERGLVAIALAVASTIMVVTGLMTIDQWVDYTKWVFLTYAAAKTVTGTADLINKANVAKSVASSVSMGPILELVKHLAKRDDDDQDDEQSGAQPEVTPPPPPTPITRAA